MAAFSRQSKDCDGIGQDGIRNPLDRTCKKLDISIPVKYLALLE